jgi:hypothetical protein
VAPDRHGVASVDQDDGVGEITSNDSTVRRSGELHGSMSLDVQATRLPGKKRFLRIDPFR